MAQPVAQEPFGTKRRTWNLHVSPGVDLRVTVVESGLVVEVHRHSSLEQLFQKHSLKLGS